MKTVIIVIIVLAVLGVAYYLISPLWRKIEMDDAFPGGEEVAVISSGDFNAQAHEVSGRALLIETGESHIVRFENFDTVNGPDLRIYLSDSLDNKNIVDLGPIKATQGNVNYEIPSGTDISQYPYVLVWCKAFSVLFSSAELK